MMDTGSAPLHPSWFDWITVGALVVGPFLALLFQRLLDKIREGDKRRKDLYFTLMSTRAMFLSNEHVQALNSVDIVFADDKKIRALWKKCLEHLAKDETAAGWADTLIDLRVDLYQAIGDKLGFHYTTDYIKRGIYFPKRHGMVYELQEKVLAGMAAAVEHGRMKIEVVSS